MERRRGMAEETIPIFLSAGDPSGDIAGSLLIKQLVSVNKKLEFIGLGGRRMLSAGQNQIVDSSKLAVIGFWEVAKRFLFFKKLMSDTVALIKEGRPKVIVLIDYPGFNLLLAKKIKTLGIPIVYYISPQIWAWGKKRIVEIKRCVNMMLLILPFEKQIYDDAGVGNKFVGHYLLDDMEKKYIKAPYDVDSDLIVLMPGSRPQEVQRMLPPLLEAAEILSSGRELRFIVAGVEGAIDYDHYIRQSSLHLEVVYGKTRDLIRDSRLVITSSGTATLETAIIGRPMIVIYKTGLLTYLIARRLVKLKNIALVNITAGENIVPELIQNQASPDLISREATRFLDSKDLSLDMVTRLNRLTDGLGSGGVSIRAADAILEFINC
jgi:lipid-A-disaccharide synthase